MKTKNFIKVGTFSVCSIAALAMLSVSTIASAVPGNNPNSQSGEKDEALIKVSVPTGGSPVTYTVAGQVFSITAGNSAVIPAGATNITLPKGTIVSAKTVKVNGSSTAATFTISGDVTLGDFKPATVTENASVFTIATTTVVTPSGTTQTVDVATGETTTTNKQGDVVNTPVNISQPSATVATLEATATTVQNTAANTTAVTGATTDTNTP